MTATILFVHNYPSTFVQIDRKLLAEHWEVIERYEQSSKRLNPVGILGDVLRSDLVYCWFASWHSFLPIVFARLLGKHSIVVVGGYDTARVPEANYGSQRSIVKRNIVNLILRCASHVIVFSESAGHEVTTQINVPSEKMTLIYLGVPENRFGHYDRVPSALTVGFVSEVNLIRKGMKSFVLAASLLPSIQFILAGRWEDISIIELKRIAPTNVQFLGWISDEELKQLYETSSVYVQASVHEGFGMSVAEAMSAGCIPVVSKCGSLPEVVGNTGVYMLSNSPIDIANAIQQGLILGNIARDKARERIITLFSINKRREALHSLIQQFLRG